MVSVLMPVHNGERFMRPAIDSILEQTYENFELIIVDDCSNDGTWNIISSYKKNFPDKIKAMRLDHRHGAFGATNIAFKKAKGEFIAPMDSDDVAHKDRLQKEVTFLLAHPDVIVVGSQAYLINADGEKIGEKVFPLTHEGIYKKFFEVHPIVHPSCMMRRSLLPNENHIYRIKYGVNDDYYTFFTFLSYGKFANLPEFLLKYRIHGNNSSLQQLKNKFFQTVRIRVTAVFYFNYRPHWISVTKFLAQIVAVSLMPERMIYMVYYAMKGILKPQEIFAVVVEKASVASSRLREYSLALKEII